MTAFFSIPKPCSENWNEMDATTQGAFCSKCTKEVIDCTTIKTGEIKAALTTKADPCVRIFSDQIDEMNFLEWFKSLRLKIQLKYSFLFAFLIVFNNNTKAQDTINAPSVNLAPYPSKNDSCHQVYSYDPIVVEDPLVALDALDSLANSETEGILIDSTLQTADSSAVLKVETNVAEQLGTSIEYEEMWIGDIAYEPEFIGDIGCTPTTGFVVFGNWIVEEPLAPTSPFLQNNSEPFELITNSNDLALNNSRFSFYIEGDSLRFMSYAVESERIRIKIAKKGEITPFYFKPIQLGRGKNEIIFPLDDFDNGAYIVTVEGEQSSKAIELIYW
ncbi:MAG: hypothetical protein GQ574_26840 [Crocinitomix sp.]|nr:hypothetical protein [Crocinitomix sp.]